MRLFAIGTSFLVLTALSFAFPAAARATTLKSVQDRGELVCGVSTGIPGFSIVDEKGSWSGFDVDFCRAVAAAVLADPAKVRFVPLDADERFDALKTKKIDLLARNSTWTITSEADHDVAFVGVNYYDGQGFLVPKRRKITSALELGGSKVCLKNGTESEANLADFFEANRMKFEAVRFETLPEMLKAYETGGCDVVTSDVSQLYAGRLELSKKAEHAILADVISKEPLGPAVRQDDMQWFEIVKWVNYAMLNAEELGISSANIADAKQSKKPSVRRFVGAEGDSAKELGLSPDWAVNVVKAVGNYGESLDRNVGAKSPLGITRGLNHLWTMGGIQYAPPIR
ncbi:amino acid ABC transporter substrate-binding protein [Methylocystis bryophila]|uniref:Amino acid ABC transporter substrate-bindnig protein n=1 Tax=Methylocystis bryophila TaxID=655015 RepID=A0A1W6MZW6_9HYPH|nr:amino acid ABC transporter substrate-binding protein [Methylocystis bryophila]ARN83164.1 amino acid ABC transporter substrate-bindnig protein [Methylocystis bryophila]BDV39498.1 amino acid ABC transporter substrate-binding protein [Methylocystis bryophila]